MKMQAVLLGGVALALAGCGGPGGGTAASAWKITDACTTMGKDRAAKAFGKPIASTELNGVHEFGDGGAAMSMCMFKAADGSLFSVLLREAPDEEGYRQGVDQIRAGHMTEDKGVDVPGLPGVALWQPKMGALSWFPDRKRMVVVSIGHGFGQPTIDDAALRAKSIEIAKALP